MLHGGELNVPLSITLYQAATLVFSKWKESAIMRQIQSVSAEGSASNSNFMRDVISILHDKPTGSPAAPGRNPSLETDPIGELQQYLISLFEQSDSRVPLDNPVQTASLHPNND